MRRLLVVTLLAIGYGSAAGQEAQEAQEMSLTQALAQIGPNSPVRVATPADILSGRLLRVASDSLYILPTEDPRMRWATIETRAVPWAADTLATSLASVDTLWIRGGVTGQGASIGALAGGLGLPVLVFGGMISGLIPCDGCGLTLHVPVLTAVVGAGLGALFGGAVANERWRRIYSRS
jgi:hypothetical protein